MAILSIIEIPDPRLKLVSEPVAHVDASVRKLMDDMMETMYDAPGIGLVLDVAREGEEPQPLFIANPEIVWASEELNVYQEGCLSIPDYYGDVERPSRVRVRYLDRDGKVQEMNADGLLATCVQHEIDHLNGVLFIDHLSRLKRERVMKKYTKAARLRSEA